MPLRIASVRGWESARRGGVAIGVVESRPRHKIHQHGVHATVDDNLGAVDVRGAIAQQEQRNVGDVDRPVDLPQA